MRPFILYLLFFLKLCFTSFAQFVGGDNGGSGQHYLLQNSCSTTGTSPFLGGNQNGNSDVAVIFSSCNAIGLNPFFGGDGDLHAEEALISSPCIPNGVNPFYGGNEDGHSESLIAQTICDATGLNPFYGGNQDGHADQIIQLSSCTTIGVNPFSGGNQDGHYDAPLISLTCSPIGLNPFLGGIEDGHSEVALVQTNCTSTGPNPFFGGQEDGYSDLVLTVTSCNVALPVQVLFFNAQCESGRVELNWATASEKDNDYFIIERAENNNSFERIAKVKGKGVSNTLEHYSFTDINPGNGDVYYRLSQVDFNGERDFLQTITNNCDRSSNSTISPNPNNGHFLLYGTENLHLISIYNSLGDLVYQNNLSGTMNEINISALASGVYYVVTQSTEKSEVLKIVIAK